MKFVSLELNNWLVYRGQQYLDFPMDDQRNILVIFGENMHGKTSLLNAVRWALYGEALNRQRRVIPDEDLFNIDSKKDGESEFWVKLNIEADGSNYQVERFGKFKNGAVSQSVILKIDNRVQDGSSVENIINGLVAKQISQFMLFDGELLNQFEQLVVDEGGGQAKSIKKNIEKALGLPVLQRASAEIDVLSKTVAKRAQEEMKKKNNLQLLARNLEVHTENLSSKEAEKIQIEEELEAHNENLIRLDAELEKSNQNIGLAERKKMLQEELKRNKEEVESLQGVMKALIGDLWKEPLLQALAPQKKYIGEKITALTEVQKNNAVIYSRVKTLKQSVDEGFCSECGTELKKSNRQDIERELEKLQSEISHEANIDEEMAILQRRLGGISLDDVEDGISYKLSQASKDIQKNRVRNAKIDNELFDIRNDLAGFDEERGRKIKNEYDMRVREVGRLAEVSARIETDIEALTVEISQIKKHPDYKAVLTQSGTSKETNIVDGLKEIFQSAVNMYRDTMRDKVGDRASHSFQHLTTEKKFDALEINTSYGLDLVIDGQKVARSAGAEQIVALSLIEALNHLGRRKGPMLMDTPAGRLDKIHRANVMKYLPTVVTQLAIFAHSGELTEEEIYFDRSRIGKKYRINRLSSFHSILEEA